MNTPNRARRNLVFGVLLVAITAALIVGRSGLWGEDAPKVSASAEQATTEEEALPLAVREADAEAAAAQSEATMPPPDAALSFADYDEQYEALRENFRARDSLTALVAGHRVVWDGYLRNVSKQTNAFYVSVRPQPEHSRTSALVTFDHAFEEQLYTLRPDDPIRFEGVVKRAGLSVSIDGASIERIE
ncbi:MAG: hypothetical protein HKN04_04170 [Rhodothermaceae bacterium]|nr:hypothetical protein [Rhodothermaceae bacterium]